MPTMTLGELASATNGVVVRGHPDQRVHAFDIDSRRLAEGSMFFALRGEHTDGHQFLADAKRRGATAAMVSRNPGEDEAPEGLILVRDVAEALWSCGIVARQKLAHVKRLAITGSNGKTSVKELAAAGLSAFGNVHRSPGNFNNELGAPLSLLACPDDADVMVLEIAMRAGGEIAALTELVDPDVGLVTNVRAVHLEFFSSLDDIAAAKGEIYATMRDDATAVFNIDNPHLRVQATRHVGPQISFGRSDRAEVQLLDLLNRFDPGVALLVSHGDEQHKLQLQLGGAHSAFNALAALAAIVALGHPLQPAIQPMEQVQPGPGRCQLVRLNQDIVVIDDTYNSSPAALASVLETLRLSEPPGRRVLVVGDMLELGRVAGALHREAGKRAAASGVSLLISIGGLARQAAETARRSGVEDVHHFQEVHDAEEMIPTFLQPGDLVLVKGSRSMQLERIVEAIRQQIGGGGA